MIIRIQAFGKNTVLDRNVHGGKLFSFIVRAWFIHMSINGHILVKSPARRNVIDHDIADRVAANGIISSTDEGLSPSESHVPNNHVMGIDPDRLSGYTYPISRGCLAGNRNVWRPDNQRAFESDNSSYIKYNNSSSPLFQSFP